jgi:NAD(P)-dependent dehydrogenase (short-subunit alcohol dehydrogenase family)
MATNAEGRLAGKVALITGAAGAFGGEMVRRFLLEGAKIVASDTEAVGLAAITARHGDAVLTLAADVGCEKDWEKAHQLTLERSGRLDILVNNAGLSHTGAPQDAEHVSLEQWRAVQRVNVEGTLLGCQMAIRAMRQSGGSIINISSIAALNPSPNMIAYGTSKAAVRYMTRSVAAYCAAKGYNIRCNSIHPGWFLTPMVREARTPAELATQEKSIPLRRFGSLADIAEAAIYLASDQASYITGAKLVIDGGVTMDP